MYFEEWTPELVEALDEPFAPGDHKQKKQGGTQITFVDVHKYKERLNATVGPHGWACAVRMEPIGGKLVCTVALTVLGVTKENVGDEVEVPELNAKGNEKIIGAPATNSYAQAFKRACSDFGLGAYLYDEGKRSAATRAPVVRRHAPKESYSEGRATDPRHRPMPFGNTKGKKLGELTVEQLDGARKWCKETDAEKFAELIRDLETVLESHTAGATA